MERLHMFPMILTLLFLFIFYGVALGNGGARGNPGCNCQSWPEPTAGYFLWGDLTIAFDKLLYGEVGLPYYNIQAQLKRGTQVHLYSRSLPSGGKNICDYTPYELIDPTNGYGKLPCIMGIEEDFDLSGVPVIYDLKVTHKDFCGEKIDGHYPPSYEAQDAMISGKITIRVVPTTCP